MCFLKVVVLGQVGLPQPSKASNVSYNYEDMLMYTQCREVYAVSFQNVCLLNTTTGYVTDNWQYFM
jgi:hypothetical protein